MLKSTQKQLQVQKPMPVLVQKQNILMLPTLAFEQMIKQELEVNPFLEETDEADVDIDNEISEEQTLETERDDEPEVSKEDEFDIDDFSTDDLDGYKTGDGGEKNRRLIYENIWSSTESLRESLTQQLLILHLSDREYYIGEELVNLIDSEGYIRQTNAGLLIEINDLKKGTAFENEEFTEDEIEKVIGYIHQLDPPGIGARNLFECLIIQIKHSTTDDDFKNLCIKILTDYSEDLRLKRYEKLIKELGIDNEVINKVFEFISKLNPKPGVAFKDSVQEYIYPDFEVYEVDGKWKAELTEKNFPRIRLNDHYLKVIKNDKRNIKPEFKTFVKDNYEKAKWFLDSIISRRETMMLVMNYILDKQKEFFDTSGKQLVPMFEKELAEKIGRDISTISRTVRGKYVQTDFGIFELKHFFSNSMKNQTGEDISTKEIKAKMQSIIGQENPLNPFTDDELESELKKAGYNISRRTVAKYREALKIPKARLRRKI